MVTATLSRGGTSVDISVLGEGGEVALARDIGKPHADFYDIGREDPEHRDDQSVSDRFTLIGRLSGASAYSDAVTLTTLVKQRTPSTGTPLELDLSGFPNLSVTPYEVAVNEEGSLELTYPPGIRGTVLVQLSTQLVGDTAGGGSQESQSLSPDAGSGIKLDRGDVSVTFTDSQGVSRSVGRPGGSIVPRSQVLPKYFDSNAPAYDVFEVSTRNLSDAERETLETEIVRPRFGTDTLTLHFESSLYGLGAYEVVPTGSQALRTSYATGITGVAEAPTLKLRVVNQG